MTARQKRFEREARSWPVTHRIIPSNRDCDPFFVCNRICTGVGEDLLSESDNLMKDCRKLPKIAFLQAALEDSE